MIQLLVAGAVALLAFVVFTVVDTATISASRIRALNRVVWILLELVLPILGAVLWFALGRAGARSQASRSGYRGPEDDPGFVPSARPVSRTRTDKERDDATLRQLEQQLLNSDEDGRDSDRGHR
ncbi:PLD nuclease N-terminal domain-containing protein [Curtobacterium ammoniigenes]|uniref:PLD nuclease N-terminal domain-containing protein n=1 Tax=Curtobacterium ammoniigenes TaxID=395387 RepID=UPI0009F98D86|nr:PLD nuclease N-terminal domain-containing protein [Curtobacterium ammoniigenes]